MIKKITAIALLLASQSFLNAATITLNKGLSSGFTILDKSGTSITGTVFIGTFASGTAPSTPGNGDYSSIISAFNTFGSTSAPAAGSPITGSVTATPGTPATFNTYTIYMIVANNASLASATQFGLYKNTTSTFFPADTTAGGSTNFNVTTGTILSAVAGAGTVVDNASGADNLKLVSVTAIPEASTALLGAIGALGLLRRRRN